jgi:hypothetical protein
MIDEADDDAPVIDFGCYRPFGYRLTTASTPGWIDEDCVDSARDHELALGKIKTWLEAQGRGRNVTQTTR